MRTQEFVLGDGLIVATTALDRSPFAIHLSGIEGWSDLPEFERNVQPRLFGHGAFYGKSVTFGPKEFSVTMFTQFPNSSSIRGLRTNIIEIGQRINNLSNAQMVYYQDNIEVFRERMYVLPQSPFTDGWQEVHNGVEIALNFLAPSPYKDVFQNGDLTVSEKRL